MRRDGFVFWLVALSAGALALNVALNYFLVGSGGWGLPFAFLRWSSAPPPLTTRDFHVLALAADIGVLALVARLCSRRARAHR
ncbi:MAG TPA: hypothetical protein VG963_21145 [Polyangiaceae bacterium]|nr:hypothetical protein [Polyangiaceae bacterium]